MNTTAAMLVLVRLVLGHTVSTGQDINTNGLVDDHGFAVTPVRRFVETAQDRFGATLWQAQKAAIVWVRAGRPSRPELV